MDYWKLSEYFKKLYISSYYGIKKDTQDFFRVPIDEFGISTDQIIFVDDSDVPLDTASSMDIKVYKMDRYNKLTNDKYPVIHNLKGI
jgi:HAD superfamily hydrolase (TIGR01509 family)